MAAGSVQAGGTLQQGGGGVSCVTGPGAGHHHPDTFIVIRPDNFTHRDKSRDHVTLIVTRKKRVMLCIVD